MKSNKLYYSAYKNWKGEMDAYTIYKVLSDIEKGNKIGELFENLSHESFHQAKTWQELAHNPKLNWQYTPDFKIKMINSFLKTIGPKYFLDFLSALKIRGISLYRVGDIHLADEKFHAKIKSGTNLRAAIFGINDGLVSNASLVFAMIGANSSSHTTVIAGVAGLLAGAFSMASGEYISVKSQTELYENQIAIEGAELQEFPEEEAKELSLIYQAKGLDKKIADNFANNLVKDKEKALDTLAREELGLDPNDLGSPLEAAISSFISFSIGALVPLLPFMILEKQKAMIGSFTGSLVTLFFIGLLISILTGKSPLMSGIRMCLLGLVAGAATFFIGNLIGVNL